ncbi:MAG: GNAT family N-acetyltransferase, partial [Planctomycetota bacterium]|nr:GNAT family N-acetyltransferase [Planctomycetota bacterium]
MIDSIDVVAPGCLQAADWRNWSDLQRSHACYESPSLRPEYTKLLVPLRPNLRVAVMRYRGASVGFFPYVVETPGIALPAGRWLMSFQTIVRDPRYRVDPKLWLTACQVRQICFDRMVCPNDDFAGYSLFTASSPVVDLRNGYDDYVRQLQDRGSQLVTRLEQKKRRVMRDCSTIDLVDESENDLILERLVSWRRQRNREILAKDFLSQLWTRQALQEFCRQRDDLFCGRLFVLRFGGRPVAALVCLQSGGVLECVMTAFDPELRQYSPGLLLFYFLLRDAIRYDVHRVHLTRGTEQFKERFENDSVHVSDVAIGRPLLMRQLSRS